MLIGVLGGGQLGRMLALAGHQLGLEFTFVDPAPDACAGSLGRHLVATYDDPAALDELVRTCEVVTFEFERVPAAAAERLSGSVAVRPRARALLVGQDRVIEKKLFSKLGLEVPRFAQASSRYELDEAIEVAGLPAVIKTRTEGYDGKGQVVVGDRAELDRAWELLGGKQLIVEELVPFERELSLIAVRAGDGTTVFYPPVENRHEEGILRSSRAPALGLAPALRDRAEHGVSALLALLDYVGVLAVEFFQAGDRLLANEFAPRVHNSGHWTIEGAVASQFENHLRAVCGLPLGSTEAPGHAVMLNCIGDLPDQAEVLAIEGAHLHRYGKSPRPGRKVGHVTLVGGAPDDLEPGERALRALGLR
ncbi:MAG: 5-(carboxyamino)imidazole ribonucleotide synthase [Actinomycetota bacterium]